MIIVDTNVLSEVLRPAPDANVVAWLNRQATETLYLCTVTLAEIRFGIAALPDGKRKQVLGTRFESELVPLFASRVLPFDEPASRTFADFKARCKASGLAVGPFDAVIASIALERGFGVATRDQAPFHAAGVAPVINPFAASA